MCEFGGCNVPQFWLLSFQLNLKNSIWKIILSINDRPRQGKQKKYSTETGWDVSQDLTFKRDTGSIGWLMFAVRLTIIRNIPISFQVGFFNISIDGFVITVRENICTWEDSLQRTSFSEWSYSKGEFWHTRPPSY